MTRMSEKRVLLIEDQAALARTYMGFLRDLPLRVSHAENAAAARKSLEAEAPDVILLDLRLPDVDGFALLDALVARPQPVPVMVITGEGSIGIAVEAMRRGAADFLVKPFTGERLRSAVEAQLGPLQRSTPLGRAQPPAASATVFDFEGFIGNSPPMQAVYRALEAAARSKATVFITGESGTGKEICAEAIHRRSDRADKPFVVLNCAAIPSELMEAEIFGHVKGAFTGAITNRIGAAKLADGGTLFLDELCEMPLALQAKLLRFVQFGVFNPVGQPQTEQVDVRFICATNRDPMAEVIAGRFREDLFYRLHVLPVRLPPLRERGADILRLAQHFLQEYARQDGRNFTGFDADAARLIAQHPWPGNIRQLQNVLRQAVVLHQGPLLTAAMLSGLTAVAPAAGGAPSPAPRAPTSVSPLVPTSGEGQADLHALARLIRPLADVEREHIEHAVSLCDGDVRRAAVFLDVSPATIYRKLKQWRGKT